jgi:mannose-1-phosphate guanylyltransferase
MKAFLLAAGHGTRLRPLTDHQPKCLLPIKGKPLLAIWLEQCHRFGIGEVLVNIHSRAAQVRQFLERQGNGVHVQVVEEPALRGSAGTLRANASWVAKEEYFWVFYADVLTRTDLASMLKMHMTKRPAATLGVYRVPHPERCGIVQLGKDEMIREFVEKPTRPASDLAFSGLMIATPKLLAAIPPWEPCDIGFDLLPRLGGRMLAYRISDYLIDIGTPETYQHAQETWPGQ